MFYIRKNVYEDKLSNIDFLFVKTREITQKESLWQPVKKIMPFVYIKKKHTKAFIDYNFNFKLFKEVSTWETN